VGQVFGKLTVVAFARRSVTAGNRSLIWLCRCECGNPKEVYGTNLKYGRTRSCGCARGGWIGDANRTHGKRRTPEYTIWCLMRRRCLDAKCPEYKRYGGRGIQVCSDWLGPSGFASFVAHIGPRPTRKHSIDRFPNNDGNYEPGNVRWATPIEQANNKSTNVKYVYAGVWRTVSELARESGVREKLLRYRLSHGWSVSRAIADPSRIKARHPNLSQQEQERIARLRLTIPAAAVAAAVGVSLSTVKNVLRAARNLGRAKESA
jgi:hypothetical protein